MLGEEGLALTRHGGMDERLEPAQLDGLVEHAFGERGTVDAGGTGRPREPGLDLGDQRAFRALEAVDDGVGIEHRHAFGREHPRDGALAHADRAGEAESDHRVSSSSSSASCPRGGIAPNRRWKDGAACSISMDSPFSA